MKSMVSASLKKNIMYIKYIKYIMYLECIKYIRYIRYISVTREGKPQLRSGRSDRSGR